ncbi:MAG: RNA ligase family protein [Gammaproteobacteria bacterium]|nr:RNA ligase family protein [Gammaproteobacteria bacterium]
MSDFFRFPHTPHLAWLGQGKPRDDKVLEATEARAVLSTEVVVEEKVDGANLGFSLDEHGTLRGQNRGGYLDLDSPTGQWKPLKRWLSTRRHALAEALTPDLILFGEWCYAVHSVCYTRLPDWFLVFDVYDRARGEFWNVERRNELAHPLDLAVVPELGRGVFCIGGLKKLLGRSALTDGPAEGLYVRREQAGDLMPRAKLVRPEFVQNIEEHWSKRRIEANNVVGTTAGRASTS